MGYPVVSVAERGDGILVRQDRFLETGPVDHKNNQTIWYRAHPPSGATHILTTLPCRTIPLNLLTVSADGSHSIRSDLVLDDREMVVPLDSSQPFKLNAGTTGFCTSPILRKPCARTEAACLDVVQYSAELLENLGQQVVSPNLPFSTQDRVGLVRDAFSLVKAGYTSIGTVLDLVDALSKASECELPLRETTVCHVSHPVHRSGPMGCVRNGLVLHLGDVVGAPQDHRPAQRVPQGVWHRNLHVERVTLLIGTCVV